MRRLVAFAALLLSGCDDVSMAVQPKYDTYAPSHFWDNGASARPIPAHTVAQGDLKLADQAQTPPPVTDALMEKGKEQFNAFCAPCHGLSGYGDGMIVQRGFPAPPSYHQDKLRDAPSQEFFDVITKGHGVMYSYADRVAPEDRWAIIAYIRALQLSQSATASLVPEAAGKLR